MLQIPYALAILDVSMSVGPADESYYPKEKVAVRMGDIVESLRSNFPGSFQKGRRILGYKSLEGDGNIGTHLDFVITAQPETIWHVPYSDWPVGKVFVSGGLGLDKFISEFGKKDFLPFIKEQAEKEGLGIHECGDFCCLDHYFYVKVERSDFPYSESGRKAYLEAVKNAAYEILSLEEDIRQVIDRVPRQKYNPELAGRSEYTRYTAIMDQTTLGEYFGV